MGLLSVQEKIDLSHLEQKIEVGKRASLEMALALLEIRDRKLYREQGETFEQYCLNRWEFTDRYARNLIEYAKDIRALSGTIVPILPANEGQSRPLRQLESLEQKVEALEGAAALSPSPNSSHISRAVAAVKAKTEDWKPGDVVTVLDESSPYYGQEVEVLQSEGIVVTVATPDRSATLPLLSNEIRGGATTEQDWQPQKPKPSGVEQIQARAEIAETRVEILEEMLARLIGEARAGGVSEELLTEAEELIL